MKKFLASLLIWLVATSAAMLTAAYAQNAITLPIPANTAADLGNGPLNVRIIQGNASIFTAQGSGRGSTSGTSTALTLTATPATAPLVGALISGAGITSGTKITAYNGTTGITLSASATVPASTLVAWGAACPSSAAGIPAHYIVASISAGYYLFDTQARVCAVSPGSPVNTLLILPVFYDASPTCPTAPVGTNNNQCASTAFVLANGGGGGGAVSAVSNADGTLTISPTTGAVVASLALSNANTWLAQQTNQGATTTSPGWYVQLAGDTMPRVRVGLNATDVPSIAFGPGNANRDAFIERLGAGSLRFGAPDAAAPVAQILSVQNVVAGTSNTAGPNTTINGSQGTGTGAGGSIVFKTAPAGSTGTAQNALVTTMSLFGSGGVNVGAPTGGDKGAGTVNATGLYVNGTAVTGAGITALTGDVTASGPGSAAATLASTIVAAGPIGSATVAPVITFDAKGRLTAVSSATITPAIGSVTGLGTGAATALGNTAGGAGGFALASTNPYNLTGDVTSVGNATTLVNIPTGTTQAGQVVGTNIAAPSTPAAAHVTTWMDSTDLRMHDKNASGTIGTTVVADAGASNNFLTAISAAGVISKAQPTFANLASTPTTLSGYGITSPLPVAQGGTALSSGTSGGVLAYTASGTLASSGALTANAPVIGGGAGVVPTVGSRSGNTTSFATTSGALTNAHVAAFDASGNIVDGGVPSGTGTVTSATCNGLAITTTGTCPEPFGFENCSIALSASAGALTIALKDASGADPSATSPCRVAFGNSTLTTGSHSFVSQTAALSTILASANTMGVTSATAFRLYVGVLNNAGAMELWAYIASTATNCAPINANNLQTTQADSGNLGPQVYGSTTVRSNVAIKLLAEAEWSSTGLTAGTWTTTNLLSIRTFGPGIYKPCEIIRSFTTSTNSSTATTSSTAAATTNTGSITLSSAANLVEVSASGGAKVLTGVSTTGEMVLRQGTSTNIGAGANFSCTGTNCGSPAPLGPVLDKPNTTSSQAYTVYTLTTDNVTAFTYPFNSISTIQGTMLFKEIKG